MTTTGQARVLAAAREHGWTVVEGAHAAEMTKPNGRRVYIGWSVRGAVTYGADARRRFVGSGKADQVIAELAR